MLVRVGRQEYSCPYIAADYDREPGYQGVRTMTQILSTKSLREALQRGAEVVCRSDGSYLAATGHETVVRVQPINNKTYHLNITKFEDHGRRSEATTETFAGTVSDLEAHVERLCANPYQMGEFTWRVLTGEA